MDGKKETYRFLGIIFLMLCIGLLACPLFAEIYIPTNTSIGAWDGKTYTLYANITVDDTIVIEENGLILDGNKASGTVVASVTPLTGDGIVVDGKREVVLKNLKISNFNRGIYIADCTKCRVTNSNIYGNSTGITLTSTLKKISENNDFIRNTIKNNGIGLDLGTSAWSTIFHNNFIENGNQVICALTYDNTYSFAPPIGGNYYNDWTGTDSDGDGIMDGEEDERILPGGTDEYPFVAEYSPPIDPLEAIDIIIALFVICEDDGSITSRGLTAEQNLSDFLIKLDNVKAAIIDEDLDPCDPLAVVMEACDGEKKDLITGWHVPTLFGLIEDLAIDLGCL